MECSKPKKIIIAIDGFSSCGKSTFAKTIAAKLGYIFIDTGAMYRAVTLYALEHGAIVSGIVDEEKVIALLDDSSIRQVREKLVAMQQAMGRQRGVVMDGRDIGTVVFPNAEMKIFMTADPEVRARRRYDELLAKGDSVSLEEIRANIVARDKADMTRAISPLRQADDAVVLDNSHMTVEEQMTWFMERFDRIACGR